jgi:hypothetical protein
VFPPSPNLQEPSPRIRVSDLISWACTWERLVHPIHYEHTVTY